MNIRRINENEALITSDRQMPGLPMVIEDDGIYVDITTPIPIGDVPTLEYIHHQFSSILLERNQEFTVAKKAFIIIHGDGYYRYMFILHCPRNNFYMKNAIEVAIEFCEREARAAYIEFVNIQKNNNY
jgi:hypothetical protein